MTAVSQAIRNFLLAQKPKVHNADMLDLASRPGMEIQLNVDAQGVPVEGRRNTWDDGQFIHHHIRIPKDAGTSPHFDDYELRFPPDVYAECIGITGFNWLERRTIAVGFDFDAITGHAPGIGISQDELQSVRAAALLIDWVRAYHSTSGRGCHLWAMFEDAGFPCENHTEHAALARVVLSLMSEITGFDFTTRIDACGGNMWVWSRRASVDKGSYRLIKPNNTTLSASDLPANWRDNVEVISRRRSKVRVRGLSDQDEPKFDDLTASRKRVPLTDKHRAIRDELAQSGYCCTWLQDHWLLQTHTVALKALMLAKRPELGLVGFFDTLSEGTDPASPNCFMFPIEEGGWRVYRFSPGTKEHDLWQQDGYAWTTCGFNVRPDLVTASKVFGGVELQNNAGFVFKSAKEAVQVAEALGAQVELPEAWTNRAATLKENKDQRLVFEVKREGDDDSVGGWAMTGRKDKWARVFNVLVNEKREHRMALDSHVRALVTTEHEFEGYYVRSNEGTWDCHPLSNAKMALQYLGYSKPQAEQFLGAADLARWVQVSIPFAPEFPGGRQWNRGAAQLKIQPAEPDGDDVQRHPHWDLVYQHCGQSLDDALKNLEWAQEANIRTGADYLRTWVACMIRSPFDRLPYLFLYGPENSGKSILWESLQPVMTGITKADRALTSQNDFNGELAHTVFAVIEEKDLSRVPGVANKIKDVITSMTLAIRKMRTDTYQIPNVTHWAQFSNHEHELAIGSGDTRVTALHVPELPHGQEIPKTILLDRMTAEAPYFLRTLMDLKLPALVGRLRLPVVETKEKRTIIRQSNPVAAFVEQRCILDPKAKVLKSRLWEEWEVWCLENAFEKGSQKQFLQDLRTATRHKVTNDAKARDPQDGKRKDAYGGIKLRDDAMEHAA